MDSLEVQPTPEPETETAHLWGLGSIALLVLLWAMIMRTTTRK